MSDFWTRRRAAVEAEDRAITEAAVHAKRSAQETALAARSDEELLRDLELPAPESVDNAELLQRFMRSALPRRLKQRALRQFWRRKPVLACLDGLVDYADDYTDAATCVPDLQTSYQVGKGLLAHVEALAQDRTLTQDKAAPAEILPNPEVAEIPVESPPVKTLDIEEEGAHTSRIPGNARRMRFRFEEPA